MESRSERRLVTCVFIDIVGSTDLTRTLGAERMQRTLSEAFSELSRIAAAEGGTVEKYIGDEVFVLFGAPLAHSDDVLRALRGAEASLRWARFHSEMGLRIGIETGEALVDLRAVDDRQRMAVGTCVNVAARLQAHAGPGEILVGPVCRAAAASFADFVELGPLELKGLGMVRAARLVGLVDTETLALPFVGRGGELARLRAQFEQTKSGRATLALISGEPGIGKSRLADEFAGSAEIDASILRARFRPGTELGTSPLAELVAGTQVEALPAGVAHSAGLMSDPRLVALPLLDRRNEIFVAWRDYLAVMARTRPLLIVLDDIQWAETEFVRLLDRLTFGSDTPLMVLATARPEFPAMTAFRPGEDHLVLELGRLDEEAAGALARVAGEREAARVQRAAGHPLFIVELVRARTALASDVPVNVQAAIGARLDELTPTERDLLQRAAVVGETFTVRDAALLAERDPAEVAGILGRLAHLRHVDAVDGGAFRFHHSLVRDVAYGRLPIAVRMRLHARFAREGLRADQVGALAYHWWEALGPDDAEWVWEGDPEMPAMRAEALRAHITAGGQLAERFSSDRAFEIFEHALKLAAGPHDEAEVEEGFALALARNAKGDDATQHRFRAIELYRSVGARIPPRLYADTLDLAVFNWGYFQRLPSQDRMRALMDEGTAAARAEGDAIALVRLLGQRGYFTNDPTVLAEIDPILAGVADKRPFGDALWRLGLVHLVANDDCARALATFDLAFDLAQQGARFNEPEALAWHVITLFHVGDLARAEMSADRLLEISATKAAHTRQHALGTKALVRFGRGDWSGVQAISREIRALVERNPDASWCLMGANAVGYDAIGEVLRRVAPSSDAAPLVERMLPEAPATRAAVLLLPSVLAGAPAHEDEARRSYARETGLWERESVWDVAGVNLVLAEVAAERWNQVETELPRIDRLARKGAGFAAALGAAIREEVAASRGGPEPRHEDLHRLGYRGISELLSYRVRESGRMPAGAR